ncbi:predicted protein [Arabidopsis lyrata subsp. lyrata]|uniref:Predicted protein n=1 Tax=Arabidopsis lyrata subsp. lyrata TaxID=81972 RepID=D7LB53_ARALL|nr:predicted protein [Arabidopsis lyrata subsp. lyrata]
MENGVLDLSDSDDDEEESQGRDYVPTGDAYMAGIRNNIAEQLWRNRRYTICGHRSPLLFTTLRYRFPLPASALRSQLPLQLLSTTPSFTILTIIL